jgi:hypothetical protein
MLRHCKHVGAWPLPATAVRCMVLLTLAAACSGLGWQPHDPNEGSDVSAVRVACSGMLLSNLL